MWILTTCIKKKLTNTVTFLSNSVGAWTNRNLFCQLVLVIYAVPYLYSAVNYSSYLPVYFCVLQVKQNGSMNTIWILSVLLVYSIVYTNASGVFNENANLFLPDIILLMHVCLAMCLFVFWVPLPHRAVVKVI